MKRIMSLIPALCLCVLLAAPAMADGSPFVGDWRFYSRESDDPEMNVPHEMLLDPMEGDSGKAKEEKLNIREDGSFEITDAEGSAEDVWTDTGGDTGTLRLGGEDCGIAIEDGLLALRTADSVTRYEKTLILGTTACYIVIPADYAEGEAMEGRNDLIALYRSDRHLMDFMLYQLPVEKRTFEDYAAEEYGADGIESLEVNGILLARFETEDTYPDKSCRTAHYVMDAVDEFVEIAFRLDGEDAAELTEKIVSSLTREQTAADDMAGTVVEKLIGDFFPEIYIVHCEDGADYECFYFAMEELKPGASVMIETIGEEKWILAQEEWDFFYGGADLG